MEGVYVQLIKLKIYFNSIVVSKLKKNTGDISDVGPVIYLYLKK
jgi:hypothetical protein